MLKRMTHVVPVKIRWEFYLLAFTRQCSYVNQFCLTECRITETWMLEYVALQYLQKLHQEVLESQTLGQEH